MMSLRNMVRGLENDAPANQLIALWEHDADTLKFWRASSNFVYVFERNGERHYLRFIHEEDNTINNIRAELDFMLFLISQGYPAVAPVRSTNGLLIETISTEYGLYYGVVFDQAKGRQIPLEEMSDIHYEQWGQSLAALHLISERYRPQTVEYRSWLDALNFVSSVLERYPGEAGLRQELGRLRRELSELPTGKRHTGLIHYDFETDNIFYDDELARYCAIDFDDSMHHWFMMDVAAAISDLYEQEGEEARGRIVQFLAGYRSVKPLDEKYTSDPFIFQKFADLYTFARLLRSTEGMDDSSTPEWAVRLKDKLIGFCDRIRERYRTASESVPIDSNN